MSRLNISTPNGLFLDQNRPKAGMNGFQIELINPNRSVSAQISALGSGTNSKFTIKLSAGTDELAASVRDAHKAPGGVVYMRILKPSNGFLGRAALMEVLTNGTEIPAVGHGHSVVALLRLHYTGDHSHSGSGGEQQGYGMPTHSSGSGPQRPTTGMQGQRGGRTQEPCRPPEPLSYQIFITHFNGKTFTFRVTAKMMVQELRKLVHDKMGVPPAQQRLLYGGQELQDGNTLKSYGIGNEATLQLVGRLRGG